VWRRQRLAQVLDTVGVTSLLLGARSLLPPRLLPALTFHRVTFPEDTLGFDAGVVDATPESFDTLLGSLARHFTTVGVDELLDHLGGAPLPKNPIVITFDDGYRDNLTNATPILAHHGLKAIFFVATDYVDRRRPFWWDLVAYFLGQTSKKRIELEYPEPRRYELGGDWLRVQGRLLRTIKDTFSLDLDRFLDGLAAACEVEWNERVARELADQLVLDWNDVRALRAAGMDVGSHTRSHRVLHQLPPAQLTDELSGSKTILEAQLGEPVRALSYPVGGREVAERPVIRRAVREAGYQLAFSNGTGVNNLWRGLDRFGLRRFTTGLEAPESFVRSILVVPSLSGQK
jgi:peptidoglycan/xylan/chitin deacetylase (PgdA/CDA1 family)